MGMYTNARSVITAELKIDVTMPARRRDATVSYPQQNCPQFGGLIKILTEIVHAARNRLLETRTADGLKAAEMLANEAMGPPRNPRGQTIPRRYPREFPGWGYILCAGPGRRLELPDATH